MMGSASIMRPIVEGMVSRNVSRMARASSARNARRSDSATTSRDSSGSVTVPSATPNRPSGSCINRKAMASQNIAPVAERRGEHGIDQHIDLGGAGGDHRRPHQRQDGEHARDRASENPAGSDSPAPSAAAAAPRAAAPPPISVPMASPTSAPRAEVRIDQRAERDAADDGSQVEEARRHRGDAEDALRVQHAHDQRRERHQQDEGEHDARERARSAPPSRDRSPARAAPPAGARTPCRARTACPSTSTVSVATLFASRHAAASPSRAMVLLNVVTNAVDSAPSANRSRNRFGMRNAAVKSSMAAAPNSAAQDLLAHQAEHPAAHHGDADDPRRPGIQALRAGVRARRHRRRPAWGPDAGAGGCLDLILRWSGLRRVLV